MGAGCRFHGSRVQVSWEQGAGLMRAGGQVSHFNISQRAPSITPSCIDGIAFSREACHSHG